MTDHYIVKVCGMRDADNIREVEQCSMLNDQCSIDWMGFIFWPKSSRFVSQVPAYLPEHCQRVGVFVDASIGDIMSAVDSFALNYIQLHGQESPGYIIQLKPHLPADVKIIKAFNIATTNDLAQTKPYEGLADIFLFDTKGKCVGGNGEKFDWTVLDAYQGSTPFLLSGGIGPDDAAQVNAFRHPKCIGIDLNSRFELSPGLKDIAKLKEFICNLNTEI